MSDFWQPRELYSPWNSPDHNIGVGSHSLLQEIFPTQGSNPGLPQADSLPAEPQGKPLRRLRAEEFMLLNCDARGDSSESFGL